VRSPIPPERKIKIWTPAEEEQLKEYTARGWSIRQIAQLMERSNGSVSNKQDALGIGKVRNVLKIGRNLDTSGAYVSGSDNSGAYAPDYSAKEPPIPEWLDALRPVQLAAPPKYQATQTPTDHVLVAGDFHFPEHDPAACNVLLETLRQLRPKQLILNGDTVDLLAVSRYPKDQRKVYQLRDEVAAFHAFLHEAVRIGSAWGLEIVETEANHSGNGTASRWHRYLSDRVPVLYAHPKAEQLLHYENWFYPEWAPIRLVESVVLNEELLVIHGDMVRKHAAYSARGHAEKWHFSVMHSHTHRMGATMERIPAVGGREESVRRAYEIGCMCQLNPSYASAPNWTNGFAIVALSDEPGLYGVDLVSIQQGKAVVPSLGQTITGR
jgi:hypothetical protein